MPSWIYATMRDRVFFADGRQSRGSYTQHKTGARLLAGRVRRGVGPPSVIGTLLLPIDFGRVPVGYSISSIWYDDYRKLGEAQVSGIETVNDMYGRPSHYIVELRALIPKPLSNVVMTFKNGRAITFKDGKAIGFQSRT